ncbi:biopolymer transporter ExbD [bacterium]|nr:biopolymer transporter ExbD [bacterium]
MGMRFSENEDDAIVAEINITPLTDIFLVLLIIFMISSSAMLEGGLQVKLPSAKSTTLTKSGNGKPTYVTLSKDGRISVNEKEATEPALAQVIKDTLLQSSDKTVVIRGDESIFLGKAVKIMDAARAAGAEKIAIATQAPN